MTEISRSLQSPLFRNMLTHLINSCDLRNLSSETFYRACSICSASVLVRGSTLTGCNIPIIMNRIIANPVIITANFTFDLVKDIRHSFCSSDGAMLKPFFRCSSKYIIIYISVNGLCKMANLETRKKFCIRIVIQIYI